MNEKLTAYCGLCCADCIPSCEELFALVDRLEQMLEQFQLDQSAGRASLVQRSVAHIFQVQGVEMT